MDKSKIKGLCIVSFFTVLLYLLLTNIPAIGEALLWISGLLSPFIAGIILAFILDGITGFLERMLFARILRNTRAEKRRTFAALSTLVLSLAVITALFIFIIPQISASIQTLASNINVYLSSFQKLLEDLQTKLDIPDFVLEKIDTMIRDGSEGIINFVSQAIPSMLNFALSMGNTVMNFLITLTVSIHLLFGKKKMLRTYHRVIESFFHERILHTLADLSETALPVFRKYINGQLLDASIIGFVSFIFLFVFGFPYPLLISLLMGVSNIIPFFGPFIGATPSFLLILMINPIQALWYLVFVIVLQQIDGNVMAPKIIGDSVGLPPIWVLFSVAVGGSLFGLPGMVFGTPIMATIYAILKKSVNKREAAKHVLNADSPEDSSNETQNFDKI